MRVVVLQLQFVHAAKDIIFASTLSWKLSWQCLAAATQQPCRQPGNQFGHTERSADIRISDNDDGRN